MPRLTIAGLHVLSQVSGVFLDQQPVMAEGGVFGDFFTQGPIFYGGFNTPRLGLYAAPMVNPFPGQPWPVTYLGPQFADRVNGFWTDGQSRWLGQYSDGARDSDGNWWKTGRVAIGATRQGDWLFKREPDFQALIVRHANGVEETFEFGQFFDVSANPASAGSAYADRGIYLVRLQSGALQVLGSSVVARLPLATPITVVNGRIFWFGYQSGWGLCCGWIDESPTGYLVSGDGLDFWPSVQARNDGMIAGATAVGQADYPQRAYVIDQKDWTATVNGGAGWALRKIDVMVPPVDVPAFQYPVESGVVFPNR